MDINGNNNQNPFNQNLNTTDNVDFTRVDVTDAITDNQQLATKLYVDSHGGGGGNMSYIGTTPATNYIYKASASNGQDAIKSTITDDGTNCIVSATNGITANKIIKSGGTSIQYLMGDGSTLTQSANSGNSNFYLYQSKNGITTPPPLAGDVGYNNAVQSLATLVYISHLTRDNIDIEVFYNQVNELNDLYIQDQNNSLNFIKYNIIGPLIPTINSYVEIPVVMSSYGGTGNTSFGSNHNVLLAFFSNNLEIDQRLTTLETKTENQTAVTGTTTFTGILKTDDIRSLGIPNNTINISSNLLNIGTSQTPSDIFNNGSSLTKNNFNTSQSVGCIGFKDNWATATGNNTNIKQGMIYMSNVGRVIVISNLTPQYFDDTTGALINCIGGITGLSQQYVYIPSLGLAYGRNLTQYVTSIDGINWTVPANILGDIGVYNEPKIIYENGLYISNSGTGTIIQTSIDGITWTTRVSTRNIYTLIYTGTRFVTFGSAGCMYSYDGITWVNDTVQTANIRAAIYCESLGCILAQIQGGNRNIIRSYDSGLTWTTLTNVFPFATGSNKFVWDNESGKAYNIADEPNNTYIYNSYLWEFDATGNSALGGSIKMMGNTSTSASSGLEYYIYNPNLKRFLFSRNNVPYLVFYSTTSQNLACSGNQYIIGSLNCSGGYNPYGLANIDIMLRDSPFIGIQYVHSSGINTTLSNSTWSSLGVTSSVASTYAVTNNFTRQLCCANWTFPTPTDGQICGYGSTSVSGAQVSRGFNFGLSAVLGISDSGYNANNCQNFWGLWGLATAIPLNQATQLSTRTNMICFGSDTNDPNICIYTAGASSNIKQVDLGASFPANRPSGSVSTDWFKFTLYWDTTKFYYKAHNTTTNVIVSGTFTPLVADIPATTITLYPQCARVMGTPQSTGQARLQVQRFGVYY